MIALTSKYRPRRIQDFAGLKRAKAIMGNFVKSPRSDSFLFHGASGTGKTTLALAVAAELGAQVIHIPAAECSVDKVRWLRDVTACTPMFGRFYVVIVDEADRMSPSARVAFLSLLDATGMPDNTVFIFTSNETPDPSDRFVSRCKVVAFDGAVDANSAIAFLYRIWYAEAGTDIAMPEMLESRNIAAQLTGKGGNLRAMVNEIELELMAVAA